MEKAYNYLYKITNNINNKIYIGIHSTDNLDDGYMGSGALLLKAINKYGQENFSKEILYYTTTREDLLDLERFIVTLEFIDREDTYNLAIGGEPGEFSEEHKLHLSEAAKKRIEKYGVSFKGCHHSEEAKQKMRSAKKNFTPWNKGLKGVQKNRNRGKRGIYSEETLERMRIGAKKRCEKYGPNITTLGWHWYNNGIKNVFCSEQPEGFIRGRIMKLNNPDSPKDKNE